jgi:hypothetical protein
MGDVRKNLFEMFRLDAEAQRAKALLTLELLSKHATGIGDHSTTDFYNNANQALQDFMDANDKLETIEKYFKLP